MTVAIAAFNAARQLETAIASAQRQTLADIEILIVDDASTDDTAAVARQLSARDPRVRVERLSANGGPAAARNHALGLARGRWFAILDSDDLYAPDRLATLVAAGEAQQADIVADDMIVFDDDGGAARYLKPGKVAGRLPAQDYLRGAGMRARGDDYGYLKPLFRLSVLRRHDLRYNPALRIAEDDDLIVRALLAGLRYWIEPVPLYGYRRHAASTSHRLSARNAAAIVAASERLCTAHPHDAALRSRHAGFARAATFAKGIEAIKRRNPLAAAAIFAAAPGALPMLWRPVAARFRRIAGPGRAKPDPAAEAALARMLA